MLIGTNFNFDQNQLILPVIHNLSSAPGSGVAGQLYTNTTNSTLNVYLGNSWYVAPTASLTPPETNYGTYWETPTILGGKLVQNGFMGHDSAGAVTTPSSTTAGAAVVATTASGPIFGKITLTQPATQATLTLASGTTLTTAANLSFAGAFATTITSSTATSVSLPTVGSGTLVGSADTGTVTNTMLAGSIANAKLVNSSVTYGTTTVALGSSSTSIAGLTNLSTVAGTATIAPINFSTTGSVVLTTPVPGALQWDQTSLWIANGAVGSATNRKLLYADFSNIAGSGTLPPQFGGTGVANNTLYTITLGGAVSTSGTLIVSAGNVSIANGLSTSSTFVVTGALSIGNAFSTTGIFSTGGAFSTSSTFAVTGALSIGGAFTTTSTVSLTGAVSTSAGFSTTGAGTLQLVNGATNSTLTLPQTATANLAYNTTQPSANNQLAYAPTSGSAILTYVNAPSALSTLTQSSSSAAPSWTTATGTGAPVFGTNPTMTFGTAGTLTLNYAPTSGTDAANKTYVDNVAIGLNDWKQSVRVATTGNISLAGGAPTTVNTITLAANDRILVKNQTLPAENGIYIVTSLGTGANGIWTRSLDANVSADVTSGMYLYVEDGTATNKGQYVLNTTGPIVLGTTSLNFVRFNGGSTLVAGNGIDITGDSLSVKVNSSTTYLQYAIPCFDTINSIGAIALPTANNLALAGLSGGMPYWSTLVITPTGGSNATLSLAASSTLALTGGYVTTFASSAATTLTLPAVTGILNYHIAANTPVANQVPFAASASGALQYAPLYTAATSGFLRQSSSGVPAFTALTATDLNTAYGVATSNVGTLNTLNIAKKFSTTITGAGPTFTITGATHGIGNPFLTVSIYDANLSSANGNLLMADVAINYSTKDITISFGYGAPGSNTYTVVVTG